MSKSKMKRLAIQGNLLHTEAEWIESISKVEQKVEYSEWMIEDAQNHLSDSRQELADLELEFVQWKACHGSRLSNDRTYQLSISTPTTS